MCFPKQVGPHCFPPYCCLSRTVGVSKIGKPINPFGKECTKFRHGYRLDMKADDLPSIIEIGAHKPEPINWDVLTRFAFAIEIENTPMAKGIP